MRIHVLFAGMVLTSLGTAGSLAAQVPRPWGFELTAGTSHGTGGHFYDRVGPSLDALLSVRLSRVPGHAPTVAVSAGFLGTGGYDADCRLDGIGGCVPPYPHLSYRAALIGWEWMQESGATVRLLLGPARVRGGVANVTKTAVQGRAEVSSLRVVNALAPVLALRMTRVGDYEGVALRLWSWGIGLRFR